MITLFDLQNEFIQVLVNDDPIISLTSCIHENNFSIKQRLQIYRNNFFSTLSESLKNIYPVILRLVGENFFTATVKEFLSKTLPATGDLHSFGGNFDDFLANFIRTQSMYYLPAVANFEWACHQSYYAASCLPFDLTRLENMPEENYGRIKFVLHPSHQLLEYPFPILDIWQICQEPDPIETFVDLSTGGHKLLVIRPELTVKMLKLTLGEFALLSAFSKEEEFSKACSLALEAEPDFSVGT